MKFTDTGGWHARTLPDIFARLRSSERGLSSFEAKARLATYGPNVLPEQDVESFLPIFIRQFKSPLIYVLMGASALVFFLGEQADGLIIAGVLMFNACIGAIQEGRAQNTLQALKTFVNTKATVLRDGTEVIVSDEDIVPGDVIVLQEGDKVPSDARLFLAQSLRVDESALTGESEPVAKIKDSLVSRDLSLADRKNMVFKGTHVTAGSGLAIVTATGTNTEVGTIAQKVATIASEVPLQGRVRNLSHLIIMTVAALAALLFGIGLMLGFSAQEMFSTVVSLSVSIIPEGLPVVLTLVLATGVVRMSRRNALVKRLQAVEALGQASIIAVDKTGTITRNELVVEKVYAGLKHFSVEGRGYDPFGTITCDGAEARPDAYPELRVAAEIAALSANARVVYSEEEGRFLVSGDPTEAAMLTFAKKVGISRETLERSMPLVEDIPFESRLQYHASVHKRGSMHVLFVIGAPETVLARATRMRVGGKSVVLSAKKRRELEEVFLTLSREGLRVIGVAEKRSMKALSPNNPRELSFVAFLGMKDGLRAEVPDALARAQEANIRVVMITGDHRATAEAVAREAGIFRAGDEVLTGTDIDAHSDLVLKEKVANASVFARVTPEHKLRIIEAYRARGEVVAMTGDGVNDAPSLVAADLGVSMGRIGTEVAKEASDIVLLDDNFGSIVSAIEEGRSIYKTIKKVILYLFSTSLGEVLTIGGALVLGLPLPLLPAQIIWLNFVTDPFLDAGLAMEPKDKNLLVGSFEQPKKYIVDGAMVRRMFVMALPMAAGTLGVFTLYLTFEPAKALTASLTVLAIFQWFNAWNCRSDTRSIFTTNPLSNKWLLAATAGIIALHLFAVYNPFMQKILHTTALSGEDWFVLGIVAITVVFVEEGRKFFARLLARRTRQADTEAVSIAHV